LIWVRYNILKMGQTLDKYQLSAGDI
jgi:hypothetical protein